MDLEPTLNACRVHECTRMLETVESKLYGQFMLRRDDCELMD